MNTDQTNLNQLWADLIVEELVRKGINRFFLSPGSRSSPLTAAAALNKRISDLIHFDERGSAFAALGYARAAHKPAVLVCTSGTAAANFLPAVIEASMDRIPMIILTADRPPELRTTGANQTIDQVKMYGDYVRWFFDMPCPDQQVPPESVLTTIDQAVYRSLRSPVGPVHLNCMFREPLAPVGMKQDFKDYLSSITPWFKSTIPYTDYHLPVLLPDLSDLEKIAEPINETHRGTVLVGRLETDKDRQAVLKLARTLKWPVFPDIASGLRCGNSEKNVIPYYELLLASDLFREKMQPQTIVHLGGELTSKHVRQWIKQNQLDQYVRVANHPYRHDPDHITTDRFECSIAAFVDFLLPFVTQNKETHGWIEKFRSASKKVVAVLQDQLDNSDELSEPKIARVVSRHIVPENFLFIGNSMPIRDMGTFADTEGPVIPVGCNRGVSGVDGSIATSIGLSIGHNKPGTVLIGDLTFLHDVNSLAMIKDSEHPLTIIVINNNGGGIFSFLPIAQRTVLFEKYWGIPHNMTFEHIARQFDLSYQCPKTASEFESEYRAAQRSKRSTIIEVGVDRTENFQLHKNLEQTVTTILKTE